MPASGQHPTPEEVDYQVMLERDLLEMQQMLSANPKDMSQMSTQGTQPSLTSSVKMTPEEIQYLKEIECRRGWEKLADLLESGGPVPPHLQDITLEKRHPSGLLTFKCKLPDSAMGGAPGQPPPENARRDTPGLPLPVHPSVAAKLKNSEDVPSEDDPMTGQVKRQQSPGEQPSC